MTLTQAQLEVKRRFARQIAAAPEHYFRLYRKKFKKVLDTDKARELSDDYNRSNESRARLAPAVHEPAGDLVWELWKRMLAERDPRGSNLVVLTAGGAGAGKTWAISRSMLPLLDLAQIIYDTTLADLRGAVEKVEAARGAGKTVVVLYVHRPVELAVRGVVERAVGEGRAVPLRVLADNHFDAQRTMLALARSYEGDERVRLFVFHNSANLKEAGYASLDFLRKRLYKKKDAVRRRALRAARGEFRRLARAGKPAPEYVYEAIIG